MLYIIGLGLSWKDLSIKGLEAIKKCDSVYLEGYTSLGDFTVDKLEELLGKKIKILQRGDVEETQPYYVDAKSKDTALLIYGDPLSATTHFELIQEATKQKIKTQVIHAPSIFSAVAETGLSLYKFGKVASIPFEREGFEPSSFFEILKENISQDAHTLFLLDLDPVSGKFLSIKEAVERLEKLYKGSGFLGKDTTMIGCARLGTSTQTIKVGKPSELMKFDFGKAPFCLIVPGKLNFKEEEYLK